MRELRNTTKLRFEIGEATKLRDRIEEHLRDPHFDFITVNKIFSGSLDPHYEVIEGTITDINYAIRKSEQRRA